MLCASSLWYLALVGLAPAPVPRPDVFEHYTNPVLAKMIDTRHVQEVPELTPDLILDHDRVLPGTPGAFVLVRTNEGRYAKLVVQPARQTLGEGRFLPTLRVERYVTYKGGEEEAVQASGRGLTLFPGYRLSLDLGQVVPEEVGGDVRFVADGPKVFLQPLNKARLLLVVKPMEGIGPKKGPRVVVSPDKFDPSYFTGTYRLHDDGRRSGKLVLQVEADGSVSGALVSDKDGSKYEVRGKLGVPPHSIQFTVRFPRSEQTFQGHLFTGDGKALAGTSRLQEREAAFYAVREE
jgi:hypothetical protein